MNNSYFFNKFYNIFNFNRKKMRRILNKLNEILFRVIKKYDEIVYIN